MIYSDTIQSFSSYACTAVGTEIKYVYSVVKMLFVCLFVCLFLIRALYCMIIWSVKMIHCLNIFAVRCTELSQGPYFVHPIIWGPLLTSCTGFNIHKFYILPT